MLNVSTLKIDNPETYLGTRVNGNRTGSDPSKLSDVSDTTVRLQKYLSYIKSTYNIGSKDSKSAADVHSINEVLQDIDKVKQICTGDCDEYKKLLKRIAKFQNPLSHTYHLNNSIVTGHIPEPDSFTE